MKKVKQKIGIIMIILLLLSSYLTPFINVVNAYNLKEAYIYSVGKETDYHFQYWNDEKNIWSYVTTTYVGYTAEDGKFYPAYCVNRELPGVGEVDSYTVTVTEAIQNPQIWRALFNGFPYKSPSELGVANDYDAFCATKQAIYCVLYGFDPTTRFRGTDDRGVRIVNAIINIVNSARNGTNVYVAPQVSLNKVGSLTKEGKYYTQTFSVSSNVPLRDYYVYQIAGLPSGSFFADTNGNQKTNFSAGQNFKVYIPQTSIVSNVTSYIGVDGSCKSYPALYGKAPNSEVQNYALAIDPFENGSADNEIKITPTGEVTITKTSTTNNIWNGTVSGSLVPNAKYNLYNSNKSLIGTYTTNSKGQIKVSNLSLGKYYLQETTPVPQFTTLNETMYSFTLDYMGESEDVKVTNTPVPGGFFSAIKVADRNNVWTGIKKGQGVPNAKYGIFDLNGNIVKSYETGKELIAISDKNGVIFDNEKLLTGDYYLQELEAPKHYKKNDKKYYFKVTENGGHVSVTASNDVEEGGYFNIYKTSNDVNLWTAEMSGTPLANATFKVEYANFEETKTWTVTTNKDGKIVDSNYSTDDLELNLGTYRVYEIKAPNFYELDNTEYYFRITENEQKVYLELDNTPELGNNVKITKVASDKNYITGTEKGQPVSGAKYEIRTGFEERTTVTKDNFSSGRLVDTLITDEEGNTKTVTVGEGTYFVKEVSVPDGWQLDEKIYQIDVIANGVTHKLELENEPIPQGFLNINKTALEENYWTGDKAGASLEGVKFELRDEQDNVLLELVTDKNGHFSKDVQLDTGKYFLWEVEAPEHYILSDKPDVFEITENGQKVTIDITNEVEIAGFLNINKTALEENYWTGDKAGDPLEGVKFELRDEQDNVLLELVTDENGQFSEDIMLEKGRYFLWEVEAPEHYILSDKPDIFEITENGQKVTIDITNEVEIAGFLNINKTALEENYWTGDKAGDPLEGVKFELRDEQDNVLLELVTDENGQFSEDIMLEKGRYFLWEVEAPEHYILSDKPDVFEITENGQKVTIDITNEVEIAGFVDFSKVASKDNEITGDEKGTYIPNATYRVENVDTDEFVADLKTTAEGYLEETLMLKAGNYRIFEYEAPPYYLLDSQTYYFTVKENGQEVCFDFEEVPVEVKINVEKSGIVQAQPNDEIRYDFDAVESLSNVPLDNFTFVDDLPYEKVQLTKLFTGIYTDEVEFDVYYKTNLSEEWILIKENLNSKVNNFIDFSNIELAENEVITNFKMEFGTVPEYFKATTTPFIFTKVNSDLKAEDVWTNFVHLSGSYLDVNVKDDSEWTTKTYKKELKIKKLPKTGE
ncbi:MAG: hypothetical protein E7310_05080 [Clostridiales bacterium]|nr:hypothetical protein [Clostridiales bacterium]